MLVTKDAEAKYKKYSAIQVRPFVRTDFETRTTDMILIDYRKQIQSSLYDYKSYLKEIDTGLSEIILPG